MHGVLADSPQQKPLYSIVSLQGSIGCGSMAGTNVAWPPFLNHKEKQGYWIPEQLISPQQFRWVDLLTPKLIVFMLWYTLRFPPTRRGWRQTAPSHRAFVLWPWRWTLVLPGLFPNAPGLADVLSGCTVTWQVSPSSIKECRAHETPWGSTLNLWEVFARVHTVAWRNRLEGWANLRSHSPRRGGDECIRCPEVISTSSPTPCVLEASES